MSEVEAQMPEMPNVEELIQNALDQDYNKANKVFGNMMTVKLDDLLDQEKVRLADQIFNGASDVENDDDDMGNEDGTEQLELELEPESESESEESGDEEEDGDDEEEDLEVTDEEVEEMLDEIEDEE